MKNNELKNTYIYSSEIIGLSGCENENLSLKELHLNIENILNKVTGFYTYETGEIGKEVSYITKNKESFKNRIFSDLKQESYLEIRDDLKAFIVKENSIDFIGVARFSETHENKENYTKINNNLFIIID